jgi:hypothetical protein
MCAFRKTVSERAERLPRNTRNVPGQCGEIGVSRAENSAAAAPIAGAVGSLREAKTLHFIEVLAMARRLLIVRRWK